MVNNLILSLSNVQKELDRIHLGPIELDIQRGYVYAIVGQNGSGKSTLFNMILGLVHPDQGEIRLFPKKGERRSFDLVMGLAHEPELLLLDEPSSGLDPLVWSKVMDYLNRFMSSGERSILMATHITEEVRRLADYVIFINKGKLLGMYEKDAMLDEWKLLWVEGEPTGLVAGALEVSVEGRLTRIMTQDIKTTEDDLLKKGFRVLRAESLQVEQILAYLVQQP